MSSAFSLFASEVKATLRRPQRLLKLLRPSEVRSAWRLRRTLLRAGKWQRSGDTAGLSQRAFACYEDYVTLQASKLEHIDLSGHEKRFQRELYKRVVDLPFVNQGTTVLCLAARLGAEVRAFIDAGCFAIGIDLNPGKDNRFVLPGDFHELQWNDQSIDVVYCNSLDHALDIDRLLGEVRRVLKTGGVFIVEADPGSAEDHGIEPDEWATLSWETVDDLLARFPRDSWEVMNRRRFEYPRHGEQIVLRSRSEDVSGTEAGVKRAADDTAESRVGRDVPDLSDGMPA